MNNKVGVIGGMGPMATAKFMEFVINNTYAEKDQDNVNMLVAQYPIIPDRTDFILGKSSIDPAEYMIDAAKELEKAGCKFLVMPCNTATYFYDKIASEISIPLINIVSETVNYCLHKDVKKIGLMATTGTIKSQIYDHYINKRAEIFIPEEYIQEQIMDIIYKDVKQNNVPDKTKFLDVIDYFKESGCDAIIIGCTELSVACNQLNINDSMLIDSLTILAKETILKSEKRIKN